MYRKNRRLKDLLRHSRKTLVMMMAMVIALSGAIGGTLAWLMDQTVTIKNTFTVGDINIDLKETEDDNGKDNENDYEMTPGASIDKDPKVTVYQGSKACWLYVKMEKSSNFDTYLSYDMADGWTALNGVTGVYYREVNAATENLVFDVIKGNKVQVKADADMSKLISGEESLPYLWITAYAVQRDAGIDQISTAEKAWTLVVPTVQPSASAEPAALSVADEELTKEEEDALAWKAFLDSGAAA